MIAIAGHSGTGKGELVKALVRLIGTEPNTLGLEPVAISVGNILRSEAERCGLTLGEFERSICNEQTFDRWLDNAVMLNATRVLMNNFVVPIFEGRLAGCFNPFAFKVKLTLSDNIRYERISSRPDYGGSAKKAKLHTIEREKSMDERFRKVYGISLRQALNSENFHLVISSKNISPEEIARKIIKERHRYLYKRIRNSPKHLPLPIFQ